MLLTKKHFLISSSFILIASLCTITLLTKQNTQLDSIPTNIEETETITLSSIETNDIPTFRSSSFNNTHTFRGSVGTGFDFSGLGDLKITVENTGKNAFTYSIKTKNEEQLVRHTIQPNESKTFTLRSFVSSPEPGYYYLSAYNEDGSESSMRLELQPQ
ncbi:hypothetical protein CN491_00530 [Bacillus cereus]|uniref:Uncharacterized protein n=1 Tax=Bacillus cereus TaxID=1396 RepID=A0A2A8LVE8_BACCE|nr:MULTISPECIES: hypothetical protein [Bacillus cereus group]MDR4984135.1 hypothetical protein [Bacillus cereus]MEA1010831.1 hypothetical protein [Bacillus cereus]PES99379.1 hypothetical protein CN491_00530 [Bacillus cereus]PFP81635.1 hypothetical protein COJ95_05375 [Bacillus cereus]PGT19431.1 hypothetical protein COC96_05240 [Bacillus cereus]